VKASLELLVRVWQFVACRMSPVALRGGALAVATLGGVAAFSLAVVTQFGDAPLSMLPGHELAAVLAWLRAQDATFRHSTKSSNESSNGHSGDDDGWHLTGATRRQQGGAPDD